MRDHLAEGGIILAATHGPLGLDGAKELRWKGRMTALARCSCATCGSRCASAAAR